MMDSETMGQKKPTPRIIAAVFRKNILEVRTALSAGEDANAVDGDQRTALHHAAINGDARMVAVLLAAGADVRQADSNGWTPLHFAAQGHFCDVAGLLISAGAVVDAEDSYGNTPLFRATFGSRGRGEMITLLRQNGADANHTNKHGVSPASYARGVANYDLAKWFG